MRLISASIRRTLNIGRSLSRRLRPGDIVCLAGQLGSGKTILAKGMAWGLGIKMQEIVSPTFVLLRQYSEGRLPFYHFDLYRLNSPGDILGLGYEEYFYGDGITAIEWPDRLKYLTPQDYLLIELAVYGRNKRSLKFRAFGRRYKELLQNIHEPRPSYKKSESATKGRMRGIVRKEGRGEDIRY
jgi:tRNA threonylcarbamoyladenosine biosynthesis protein TsaE